MSSIEQMYQQVILDHAKTPHGRGLVEVTDGATSGQSHQVNPTCGDEVTLRVELAGDTIERVSWEGQGCSISQASLSVLTDLVTGRPATEAEHLGEAFRELMGSRGKGLDEATEDELGDATVFTGVSRYPARIKCALLGWAALRDSLVTSGALAAPQTAAAPDAAPAARATTEENR
ncbi:SUF system NifU family Fe-S cluster assembly protein [Cellulosimicrobium sp. BIT-GX5]|uniref:SUF system NifU family Fe-S cluster assembly protein n=1 Tax=Cellulosimicrobium composti TaxID=2672572 RepID=A0A6N7ZI30_9MICO|nr:SUF system NifU family Fe-S cluster assembly protein [Cellulosimicrobium composti]MTG89002.1 SUF system NifU family Fe-S cluster assembly protein [Cellulosimicrobium composti]NDO89032.1 SUF system NifU family Fe-S cluster assembly protein [Cellulosimicrobium composti]TWG80342.1 nitrogen fixation NifU-like protein [Cellulosimicrobium cellulans J34]SME99888.1 nitrogen fixation protein NifU [Cellulosimicrobium cellulans J1]